MSRAELRSMKYRELADLRVRVDEALAEKAREEKLKIRAELAKITEGYGFKLHDIVGAKMKSGFAKRHGPAKFKNPANPAETWSGRGRAPSWYDKNHPIRISA